MKLSGEIRGYTTLEAIVNLVNNAGDEPVSEEEIGPHAFAFSKSQLAGQYAAEAAWESDCIREDIDAIALDAHLDVLSEAGAIFPRDEAIRWGLEVVNFLVAEDE